MKQVEIIHLSFGNESIGMVVSYKYLGIMLDGPLLFDKNVTYIQAKLFPKMETLSRVRCYVGKGRRYIHTQLQ